MSRQSTIIIDGKCYRWRDILQMRQEQRAATRMSQLALFADLPADSCPAHERTASSRYQQPSLF
jgi:hypothetical protein